jgi:multidrug resistance efflux pump
MKYRFNIKKARAAGLAVAARRAERAKAVQNRFSAGSAELERAKALVWSLERETQFTAYAWQNATREQVAAYIAADGDLYGPQIEAAKARLEAEKARLDSLALASEFPDTAREAVFQAAYA